MPSNNGTFNGPTYQVLPILPRSLPFWSAYNPFKGEDDWAWGNNKATILFVCMMVFAGIIIIVVANIFAQRRHKKQFIGPGEAYEVPSEDDTKESKSEGKIVMHYDNELL